MLARRKVELNWSAMEWDESFWPVVGMRVF
jgi:hypothetical protein